MTELRTPTPQWLVFWSHSDPTHYNYRRSTRILAWGVTRKEAYDNFVKRYMTNVVADRYKTVKMFEKVYAGVDKRSPKKHYTYWLVHGEARAILHGWTWSKTGKRKVGQGRPA